MELLVAFGTRKLSRKRVGMVVSFMLVNLLHLIRLEIIADVTAELLREMLGLMRSEIVVTVNLNHTVFAHHFGRIVIVVVRRD